MSPQWTYNPNIISNRTGCWKREKREGRRVGHCAGEICHNTSTSRNSNKKVPVNLRKTSSKNAEQVLLWHHCRNPGLSMAPGKQTHPSSELPASRDRKTGVNLVRSFIQSVKLGEAGMEEGGSAQLWGTSGTGASEHLRGARGKHGKFGLVTSHTSYLTAKRHRQEITRPICRELEI